MLKLNWTGTLLLGLAIGGTTTPGFGDITSAPAPTTPSATEPTTQTSQPDSDNQHLNSMMDELVNVEGLIDVINKKLKLNSYKVGVASDRKENAEAGKIRMDVQGGGPVSWREFYGQTAKDFNPHSETTIDVNRSPNGSARVAIQSSSSQAARPRIFNYVYRGQNKVEANAQHEVEGLDKKNDELVARRRQLESDQSALWAQITFDIIDDREITLRALYRNVVTFETTESKEIQDAKLHVIYAVFGFLRAVDLSAKHVDPDTRANQERSLATLRDLMKSAHGALAEAMANFQQTEGISEDDIKRMKDIVALAKQMAEQSQDMCDAWQHAKEGDAANDETQKQFQRGKLQRSLLGFSATFGQLDDKVVALAQAWSVKIQMGKKHAYPGVDFKAVDKAEGVPPPAPGSGNGNGGGGGGKKKKK